MKIQLLIATGDSDYVEHLSRVLSERYSDIFEVSVCCSAERLRDMLSAHRYTLALLEPPIAEGVDMSGIRLAVTLCGGEEAAASPVDGGGRIHKYQRISKLTGALLELCAELSPQNGDIAAGRARITAVWSPAGGVGKTTVALACAARRAADGGQTVYLDLEHFSSTKVYFAQTGKSISTVLGRLEENAEMLLRGIRQLDAGSGVTYYCPPENYDDMNVLSARELAILAEACARGADELVIDLSSVCDERTRRIFELSDAIFLVCDSSRTAQVKLEQFAAQNNLFEAFLPKLTLVANRGAHPCQLGVERVIELPHVQSGDAVSVYKTLSAERFV